MNFNGWKETTFGEVSTDVAYGYTASAQTDEVGPKFLRITDIVNGLNWDTVPFCEISSKKKQQYKLEVGDIVVARTGATTGSTEIIREDVDAVFASYLIKFKINREIADPFYVGYVVKSNLWKEYVSSIIGGSAQPGANAKQFAAFKFPLPSMETQRKISSILTALDDKIELNKQTNQTLEAIAQALFKEWFVDFNFPGATGEMQDSEMSEIPKGWKILSLRKTGIVITGKTPPSSNPEHFGNSLPFITPTDFKNYNKIALNSERYLSESGLKALKNKVLPADSVLVTCIGSDMGKIAINKVACLTNQQINSIVPYKEHINSDYLYYYLLSKYELLRSIASGGSTMPIINKSQFEEIKIVVPSIELLYSFESILNPLNQSLKNNIEQIYTLTQLRDTLLPKLMKGEIDVFQAQTAAAI